MRITLCGSTRFKDIFATANEALTKSGHVVYSIACVMPKESQETDKDTKETLDLVHLMKILHSDAVVVVTDGTQYVGDSTKREIKWAKMLGKDIYLVNAVDHLCENGPLSNYPIF